MLELYSCFDYVEWVPFYILSICDCSVTSISHITKISEIPATAPAANLYRNGSGFALLLFGACVVMFSIFVMFDTARLFSQHATSHASHF
jgi:hypothetical protein